MAEEFLSDFDSLRDYGNHSLRDGGAGRGSVPPSGGSLIPPDDPSNPSPRLRIILMGTAQSVRDMIHQFHVEGIAAVSDWSRVLPVPHSDEFMSILILRR